jgi:hypothetical protein
MHESGRHQACSGSSQSLQQAASWYCAPTGVIEDQRSLPGVSTVQLNLPRMQPAQRCVSMGRGRCQSHTDRSEGQGRPSDKGP